MNRGNEQAHLFPRPRSKAAEDESLLEAACELPSISDAIYGFHCHQAAEKLLKALLSELRVTFRHTHDLKHLMDLLVEAETPLPARFDALKELNAYAVEFRYDDLPPGIPLDRLATRQLIRELRTSVESRIPKSVS